MAFLYEKIDFLRKAGNGKDIPDYIINNLNQNMPLRPYQIEALQNYFLYFENDSLRKKPTQNLFHMATGTGKTLIMSSLILYLYKHGYSNFLFFVNSTNIVRKTKENFLNKKSSKYLFSDSVVIDNEIVEIKEVDSFQETYKSDINICFTTIQGLQSMLWNVRENALTWDDFENRKIVFISDEAHHLNADTKKGTVNEKENYHSWESTVTRLFNHNNSNILLEFTATCDVKNPSIKDFYEDKIIFNYDLPLFRNDKYSKEIKTFRSDISIIDRMMLAVLMSQYRLKIFQENRLSIKPVILFKSQYIAESENNLKMFVEKINKIDADYLTRLSTLTNNATIIRMFEYFANKNISPEQLSQELKDDFNIEHCVSANDDKEAETKQLLLNSLEDKNNPYRVVFAVDKLNEGWDVLNLFDIVRLYETRQMGRSKISPVTMSEAQLIGRGARYCPFRIDEEQDRFKRKYDDDLDNPLRICEELYYHCQNDSRYITELNSALREYGLDLEDRVEKIYKLKDKFKDDNLYKFGYVFMNERIVKPKVNINGLLESVRSKVYQVSLLTGNSAEDINLDSKTLSNNSIKTYTKSITVKDISDINYAIPIKALARCKNMKFNILKSYYPNLKSMKEFITGANYLGSIKLEITSMHNELTIDDLNESIKKVVNEVSNHISNIEETYEGSKEFRNYKIKDIFKDKKRSYQKPSVGSEGDGVSQNDACIRNEWKLDLSSEDWYAYNDNYGTTEEKSFVAYFKNYVDNLKEKYENVYLLRNERLMHIYSFSDGERFEPDYLLFLSKQNGTGQDYIQVFVEPKGPNLVETDKWKEDFLLQLESIAVPVIKFVDNNKYKIWGIHFYEYSDSNRMRLFEQDMNSL